MALRYYAAPDGSYAYLKPSEDGDCVLYKDYLRVLAEKEAEIERMASNHIKDLAKQGAETKRLRDALKNIMEDEMEVAYYLDREALGEG